MRSSGSSSSVSGGSSPLVPSNRPSASNTSSAGGGESLSAIRRHLENVVGRHNHGTTFVASSDNQLAGVENSSGSGDKLHDFASSTDHAITAPIRIEIQGGKSESDDEDDDGLLLRSSLEAPINREDYNSIILARKGLCCSSHNFAYVEAPCCKGT